ncbi:HD-GYP domain-containing protein [Kineococcus rhizosphaerae]|uniref:HD domain-containing protein n=1 Tax=Kineococcus rhizosphaerae TaxID=559628 RepID=A0A2T0R045_9ACTN|nr:HD-GYP domain-containing protein [Kineococcus rhizosphaerae]PRY12245.1 HD domain-containing protein [Kineococcus rhizosphaerae]
MGTGPTQNYDQAGSTTWRPRPVLAAVVRATTGAAPVVLALGVGAAAARWAPAARLGLPAAVWLLLVVATSSAVLFACSRWLRRLVPLSALLRLSLVLPDRVPNRFAVARRTWSPQVLQRSEDAGTEGGGPTGGAASAQWLLALVGNLAAHDARTRAHGERVQAYAALIGRELGLPEADVERLSWAALLHDVGKLHVPVDVINKNGRPTEAEWAQLQQHPCDGAHLVQPLRSWLGPWLDGVEQHHERFDGAGYPRGLSGSELSLAARIIAVADTYDVITSARAYKKPMPAEQARAEITRCAGTQFDPDVVRAFLSVGIGRLRLVAGPATLLAALPGVGSLPAQALSSVSAVAQTAGGQVLAAVLAAGVGVGAGVGATQALAPAALADPLRPVTTAPASPSDGTGRVTGDGASSPITSASGTPVPVEPSPTDVPVGGTLLLPPSASTTTAPAPSATPRRATAPPPRPLATGTPVDRPSPSRTTSPSPVPSPPVATSTPTSTGTPSAAPPTSSPVTPSGAPSPAPTGLPTTVPGPSTTTGSPVTGTPTGTPTGHEPTSTPTSSPTGSRPTSGAPSPTTTPTRSPTTAPTSTASPTSPGLCIGVIVYVCL